MGACATKPKVLKDGDEKPVSPLPERPPLKEEEAAAAAEVKVVQREAENDAPLVSIESPAKNPSLNNLFIKESEDANVSTGNVKAVNASQENEAIKAPEVALGNTEALEIFPAPSATIVDAPVEKEAIKAPEIAAKEETEAMPVPATMADDVPVEKDANKVVATEKLPAPAKTIDDASIEKMDSQASEIVLEDYADALPAPASPVLADAPTEKLAVSAPDEPEIVVHKENADVSENFKEMVLGEKKSVAESLEKIPTPTPDEYTDAIAEDNVPTEKLAVGTDTSSQSINEQTEVEKLKQSEDPKLIQMTSSEETIPPLNIADKKIVEGNAVDVEKQIEFTKSMNPTPESDVKSVEILSDK